METHYDRVAELKAFDETKAGVKGLVDSGVTEIPPFFIQPPEEGEKLDETVPHDEIPVIDLSGVDSDAALRGEVVKLVKRASETMGFFQVVNHGVPIKVLDEMLEGVRQFYESETEYKKKYYIRDRSRKVNYNCNFDLYQSQAANWRDTMFIKMSPDPPKPDELPTECREITFEYSKHIEKLGIILYSNYYPKHLGLNPTT